MWLEMERSEGAYISVVAHGCKAGRGTILLNAASMYFESKPLHLSRGF